MMSEFMESNLIPKYKNDKKTLTKSVNTIFSQLIVGCSIVIGLAVSPAVFAMTDPVSPSSGEKFTYAWLKGYARA